jgi:hypothetical protein
MYIYWGNICNLNQARKIIFVFIVLTIVSSLLSAVAFVTGNSNLAFASKKSNGGSSDKGGSSSGGGGNTDNTGGGDNSNGDDTSNTSPPTSTEQTTPSAPPASNQPTTCPDGSTPDSTGNCPITATSPLPGGGQLPPECQGIVAGPSDKCSLGSNGSPISPSNVPQLTPQQQYEDCLRGIGGGIPGNCKPPPATSTNTTSLGSRTPQQQYEDCLRGIGGGIPGNCKPPASTTSP